MTIEKTGTNTFTIVRFRDGDTCEGFIRCRCCQASTYTVIRLAHLESWEPIGRESHKAAETARKLTEQYRGITGILVPPKLRFDRYGRAIADVIIEGGGLTTLIVNAGLGWWGVGKPEPGNICM